jgi:PKD repeat protein
VRLPWGTQQVSGDVRLLAAAVTDEGDIWSVFPTTNPLAGPWIDSYAWDNLCTAWPPNSGQPQTKYVTLDMRSPQGKQSLWGPGDTVQYELMITNGEADESLDALQLELTASEGLTFQSISGASCAACTPGATSWVIDLPTLAALGSQTIVIEAVLESSLSVDEITTGARLLLGSAPLAERSHTNQADGQPPVVKMGSATTLQANTVASITGTASDGNGIGVQLVEVSLDGGSTWQPATGRAQWSYALTVGQVGTVAVQVRATDLFGNVSEPVAYTFIVDDTGPAVSIAMPASVRSQTAVVRGNASDPVPADGEIVSVEVQVDSESSAWQRAQALTQAATGDAYDWRYLWNLPRLDGETRQMRARSTDAAGNVSEPSAWEATIVDTVPPVIITDTVLTAVLVGEYATPTSGGAPVLGGSVTDGYGVASMTVQVFPPSGTAYTETVLVTGDTWSYTPVFTEMVLGRYRLQVEAVDLAGNSSNLGPFVLWVQETQVDGLAAFNDGPTTLGDTTILTATIATGSNATLTWDLGDGNSATGAEVVHTYAAAGVYTATVTASNRASQATAETTVIVTGGEVTSEPPKVYLPLVVRAAPPPQPAETFPDLVGRLSISPDQRTFTAGDPIALTLEVTNQGTAASEGGFWIDLYVNPTATPTVNQSWLDLCGLTPCRGIVWSVSEVSVAYSSPYSPDKPSGSAKSRTCQASFITQPGLLYSMFSIIHTPASRC